MTERPQKEDIKKLREEKTFPVSVQKKKKKKKKFREHEKKKKNGK